MAWLKSVAAVAKDVHAETALAEVSTDSAADLAFWDGILDEVMAEWDKEDQDHAP